jgi:hypothetical protein
VATANAIAAVGQAILSLIAGAVPHDEFPSAQFELYQAKDFQSPMPEGISLYLYRITPAGEIRNYPPRITPDGKRYRQALPINLHYLLSSWAREAVKQQRLLGWAMRTLEDTPILLARPRNDGCLHVHLLTFFGRALHSSDTARISRGDCHVSDHNRHRGTWLSTDPRATRLLARARAGPRNLGGNVPLRGPAKPRL